MPKLLFDQNLSFRLVGAMQDLFPQCTHVRLIQMDQLHDNGIWKYAKEHDYIIVSQDSDFYDYSSYYGHPPKIIWIRTGNASTSHIKTLLERKTNVIKDFIDDPILGLLEVFDE